MCACTDTFTCYRCKGTRFDPDYFATLEPVTEEAFGDLVHEPSLIPPLMFGSEE
jgi:hypothetical protein